MEIENNIFSLSDEYRPAFLNILAPFTRVWVVGLLIGSQQIATHPLPSVERCVNQASVITAARDKRLLLGVVCRKIDQQARTARFDSDELELQRLQ